MPLHSSKPFRFRDTGQIGQAAAMLLEGVRDERRTAQINQRQFVAEAGGKHGNGLPLMPTAKSAAAATDVIAATKELRWAYTTRGNELLTDIAKKYGIPIEEMIRANRHIPGVYTPPPGSLIFIPLEKARRELQLKAGPGQMEENRARLIRWQSDPGTISKVPPAQTVVSPLITPLTSEQLLKIQPSLGSRASQVAADLNRAMQDAQITTRMGQAMFVAQLLHEAGTGTDLHEDGGKKKYDGKVYDYFFYMYDKDSPNPARQRKALELGNIEPGDLKPGHIL